MSDVIVPMKASAIERDQLHELNFPVVIQPKLDGVRCLIVNGAPKTKTMHDIPNEFIFNELSGLPHGFDGEITISNNFNETQSCVMSKEGQPKFIYNVFDKFGTKSNFKERFVQINKDCLNHFLVDHVKTVQIFNVDELIAHHEKFVSQGYEGTMIRDMHSQYKHGRSTYKEKYLLKLKDFDCDEAVLSHFVEKMTNNNPKTKDKFGNSKRSTHKVNKTAAGTAESLIVIWNGMEIKLGFGKGYTSAVKRYMWDNEKSFRTRPITFTYFGIGSNGKPRFPKLKSFRSIHDIDAEKLAVLGYKVHE